MLLCSIYSTNKRGIQLENETVTASSLTRLPSHASSSRYAYILRAMGALTDVATTVTLTGGILEGVQSATSRGHSLQKRQTQGKPFS